jgi:2-hydroxycyclohexanecarboxyl-CoA dehydrogenase
MSAAVTGGRLAGRTALITGAAAGIGAATAELFCTEGAVVLMVDRDREALMCQLDKLRAAVPSARVEGFAADVGVDGEAEAAVQHCLTAFGALDTLVNNAARRHRGALVDTRPEDWRAVLDVNLVGVANFCRAALPALRASACGSIVNVSSCYAETGRKGMAIYDASKAAMLALTRTLAHEEAQHKVRANAVCPGATLTDFQLARARAEGTPLERLLDARRDTSLLGRWATPEEIAWPILWLASREASYITGTSLSVDGGLCAM